jgi:hypothetical protein
MDLRLRNVRAEAWKKQFKEKIGRDHLTSMKGFVVAGGIFDILEDLWVTVPSSEILERIVNPQSSIYVYQLCRYPPVKSRNIQDVQNQ